MAEDLSTTPSQFPFTTCTSATPGLSTSTAQPPDPSSPPTNGPDQSSTFLPPTDPPLSFTPSPARANPSTGTSVNPFVTKPVKPLNLTAIAIGVTGAALLLIVCTVIAFVLWKRKQRNKIPPSAEFMGLAALRNPKFHHRTAESITSSVFTTLPNDSIKYNISASPNSPYPSTPP